MPRADDERALTLAFTRHGRRSRWKDAPEYLLRSLPGHAAAAGLVDDLLCDDAYLLHADLRRLIQVADGAGSAPGRRRAQLLRLTPRAIAAGPADRAALFSVTEALDDLGTSYRDGGWQAPTGPCGPRSSPAASAPPWKAIRAGSTACARSRGREGAAGQRRHRRHGADLGPPDRRAAHRPGRPPGRGQWRVPGHRGRKGAAGQRRRRRHGADLGPADRPAAHHAGRPTGASSGRSARSPWPGRSCWPAPATTARCGSGTPRPASSAPSWKVTRAASGRCARSPSPGRSCWPAPAATAPCGSGTPRPASSAPPWKATSVRSTACARSPSPGRNCWPAPAATGRCGSGTPRPASSAPSWKATRTASGRCARSPSPGRNCWPAPAATARCGSGTPRPASSAPPWKATRTGSLPCARSPSPGRSCWPAAGTAARCGSGTPKPASSAPPWKATRAASTLCARSPWPGRSCWPAPAATARCGSGTPRPASSAPRWKATRTASGRCARSPWPGRQLLASAGSDGTVRIWDPETGQQRAMLEGHRGGVRAVCPVTVAGKAAAGQRRQLTDGADLGPRDRPAAQPC